VQCEEPLDVSTEAAPLVTFTLSGMHSSSSYVLGACLVRSRSQDEVLALLPAPQSLEDSVAAVQARVCAACSADFALLLLLCCCASIVALPLLLLLLYRCFCIDAAILLPRFHCPSHNRSLWVTATSSYAVRQYLYVARSPSPASLHQCATPARLALPVLTRQRCLQLLRGVDAGCVHIPIS
jgi:hypothetical protein